jgi:hypothetical protein
MDRLNGAVANDVSQPDLATLSGMYLTVMSLEKRLARP